MKMKFRKECMGNKSGGNADHKYAIRGFKRHLPGDVDVAVAVVIFCAVTVLIF